MAKMILDDTLEYETSICIEERIEALNEETERVTSELLRTCSLLRRVESEGDSLEEIIMVLGRLRTKETAQILKLTGETDGIADRMSHGLRTRCCEKVSDVMFCEISVNRNHSYHRLD